MQLSRIGPIALEEPLGGDAESNVLRGVHVEQNRTLAVKLLPRQLVDRPMGVSTFAADVKRLQQLVHPNIVRVLGGAVDDGQPYLAMELVAGESLRTVMDRRRRLPWETVVEIGEQICRALDFAHGKGIGHRRLTPARVLQVDGGAIKVTGFECAFSDFDEVVGLRAPMEVMHYLAPQEIRGKRSVALPTNDLFSLGVILYEAMTGRMPWPAENPVELITARQAAAAPRTSETVLDCPVWLDKLIARLLEVSRQGRLSSADEARRAFVIAKQKAAGGVGAVQHAWSGKKGALATSVDRKELQRLKKSAARTAEKHVEGGAFYERAWFLAASLAAVVGVGAWIMWPLSENALLERARPLMASDLPTDWRAAQTLYLDELLDRFPETAHREEIKAFQLKRAMHQAEARIRTVELRAREPETEIDRLYAEALRFERFGDRLTAWQRYEALLRLYPEGETLDERAIVQLTKERIAKIRGAARQFQDEGTQAELIAAKLDRAEELAETPGGRVVARELLESIVTLYDGNQELASLVEEARQRIAALHRLPESSEGD